MVQPISNVSHSQTQAIDAQPRVSRQAPPQSKPQQPSPAVTVKLSGTAAAIQEATETSVQTTREANNGDIQARNLLAREAAAKTESQ
jgi:hypothetical protein